MATERTRQVLARRVNAPFGWHAWELAMLIGLFFLVILGRLAYDRLDVEELGFLLTPTAVLVTAITNSPFFVVEGSGFTFPSLGLILDRSCGGGHFMILLLALLVWWSRKKLADIRKRPWLPLALLTGAFLLTIAANVMRILCSLVALRIDPTAWVAGTATAHQWIGILVQLILIILSHALLRYAYRKPGSLHAA